MASVHYTSLVSLDGFIEDRDGKFDWAAPDAEVHAFINDRQRGIGTCLYGRRMYETMAPWETDPAIAEDSPETRDFAGIWQAADKIVYSTTLDDVWTTRTRLERNFDPDAIRALKSSSSGGIGIGGSDLAATVFREGLVDAVELYLMPIVVGGGKPAMRDVRLPLELVDERRFASGVVYLRYEVRK